MQFVFLYLGILRRLCQLLCDTLLTENGLNVGNSAISLTENGLPMDAMKCIHPYRAVTALGYQKRDFAVQDCLLEALLLFFFQRLPAKLQQISIDQLFQLPLIWVVKGFDRDGDVLFGGQGQQRLTLFIRAVFDKSDIFPEAETAVIAPIVQFCIERAILCRPIQQRPDTFLSCPAAPELWIDTKFQDEALAVLCGINNGHGKANLLSVPMEE